jgi:hypothetical protein
MAGRRSLPAFCSWRSGTPAYAAALSGIAASVCSVLLLFLHPFLLQVTMAPAMTPPTMTTRMTTPTTTSFAATGGDIFGLDRPDNGRSCEMHAICGVSLQLGERVVFRLKRVVVNGAESTGIAAYHVNDDNTDGCLVGYLLKSCMRTSTEYIGRHAVITEFRHLSSNSFHHERSHRNCGVAQFKFVHNRNQTARNQPEGSDGESNMSRDTTPNQPVVADDDSNYSNLSFTSSSSIEY